MQATSSQQEEEKIKNMDDDDVHSVVSAMNIEGFVEQQCLLRLLEVSPFPNL